MTGDLSRISLGGRTVSVQLTAEVAHNLTQSQLSKNCMGGSTFTTITSGYRLNTSKPEIEWRTNNLVRHPKTAGATVSVFRT
jgi:hypothetical protein